MGFYLRGLLFVLVIPHTGLLFEGVGFYSEVGLIFEDLRCWNYVQTTANNKYNVLLVHELFQLINNYKVPIPIIYCYRIQSHCKLLYIHNFACEYVF